MWKRRIYAIICFAASYVLIAAIERGEPYFPSSGMIALILAVWAGAYGLLPLPGTGWAPMKKSFRLIKNSEVTQTRF
jgi:hypothetical protein